MPPVLRTVVIFGTPDAVLVFLRTMFSKPTRERIVIISHRDIRRRTSMNRIGISSPYIVHPLTDDKKSARNRIPKCSTMPLPALTTGAKPETVEITAMSRNKPGVPSPHPKSQNAQQIRASKSDFKASASPQYGYCENCATGTVPTFRQRCVLRPIALTTDIEPSSRLVFGAVFHTNNNRRRKITSHTISSRRMRISTTGASASMRSNTPYRAKALPMTKNRRRVR